MNNDRNMLMLDFASTAAVFFTEDFKCADCNTSALDMFLFSGKDECINGFERTMPPFQASGVPSVSFFRELLASALENGKARSEIMCRQIDGTLIPAELTFKKVLYEGRPALVGSFYDLTQVKAQMKETAGAAELAQIYLSTAPLAMELFNDQYRIIDCNRKAVDLLGLGNKINYMTRNTPEAPEYLYHDTYTLKRDEEFFYKALTEGLARTEWVFQKKNGEKIPCEITRVRITAPDRVFVVSYIHDLSTVKSMAEELKKAEAIEKENSAKNQFLAQMSHILRTPLNVINGITEIQTQKPSPPETHEAFLQIKRSSDILLRIITDILDLSNANTGKLQIENKAIDVPSLVIDIAQQIIVERELDAVKLSLNIDETLPATLFGDGMRIRQVIAILTDNAFTYTEAGTVTLKFSVEPPPADYDLTLVMSVSDTGSGMSPEQAANLFDTDRSRYNAQGTIKGAGLGLPIAHRLIKLMSGDISVKSERGVGSTFIVRIPLKQIGNKTLDTETVRTLQCVDSARDALKQRKTVEYEPMPYGKVLVVDDVESNLYVAWGLMKPYGLTIDTATGGADALKKINDGAEYDIIFMDHMMPDMDGIETARAIMDTGCTTPVVALTANVIMGQAALFEENGFSGFMSKPIDISLLNTYLLKFIRDKYPEQAAIARAAAPTFVSAQDFGVSDELAKHFIRDAKNAVANLETLRKKSGFSPDELKMYTITTHGMKSALANVKETELSQVAAELEEAGRVGNFDKISSETPSFVTELKDAIAAFEAKLNAADNDRGEDDPAFVRAQLELVIDACDSYSKPAAKKALASLKEGQCSKKTIDFIDEISALLLHGEFEQAAEMAQGYLLKI
ncbi:MAG: ATP-binding protein [Defluviitaleaceae bacterium]|nr:ATP-binding protein [Defluviitaleaceae bacterium]